MFEHQLNDNASFFRPLLYTPLSLLYEMETLSSSQKLTPAQPVEESGGDQRTSGEQPDPSTATEVQVGDHSAVGDRDEHKVGCG